MKAAKRKRERLQERSVSKTRDGKETKGTWDEGGQTDAGPVVDDDDLWIGSSMNGNPGSTFVGLLDEVAVYRTALSGER